MEIRIPTRRTSIQYITMTTKQRIANNFTDVIGSVGILSVEVYGL
jgi:hypothetical protein